MGGMDNKDHMGNISMAQEEQDSMDKWGDDDEAHSIIIIIIITIYYC